MSDPSEKSCSMFLWKVSDACWAACGPGLKMDMSGAVELKKILNSCMSGSLSIISWMSLEACANAIMVACPLGKRDLVLKSVCPEWMPMTAQPTALLI